MSALSHQSVDLRKVLSYDIMCQWLRHLAERIAELPAHLRVELPQGDVPAEGSDDSNPIVLAGDTADDFAALLKYLYRR